MVNRNTKAEQNKESKENNKSDKKIISHAEKTKAKKISRKHTDKKKYRKYKKKPSEQREIALSRIKKLFNLADKVVNEYKEGDLDFGKKLANRYVEIARRISMKYKVRIPSELKRRFCKKCHSFLIPGLNVRVRIQGNKVVYTCLECGNIMRFPYVREIKKKRKRRKIK